MREILLIAILIPLCGWALVSPLVGVYTYVWFALLRPDILAYAYRASYSTYIAAAALIGMLRYLPTVVRLLTNPITLGLIVLQIPVVLSHYFSENPSLSIQIRNFETVIFMSLMIPLVIHTARQLWLLIAVMAGSVGLLGIKFGLFGLVVGGAYFREGYGGMMTDNNDVALAFCMVVPLLWFVRKDVSSKILRLAILFAIGTTFAGIVMTHSRGGAVTLGFTLLLIIWRSKNRAGLAVFLILCIGPSVYLVRETYFARLETLRAPEEEASANSRIELAKAAIELWKEHPYLGHGFGGRASRVVVDSDQLGSMVHNTYLQMLVDSGIFAALIYVGLLWGTILWLEFNRRKVRRNLPHLANIPEALQISLLAFALGSTFLSRVLFDFTYMLLTASASWLAVYKAEMAALQQKQQAQVNPAPSAETAATIEAGALAQVK